MRNSRGQTADTFTLLMGVIIGGLIMIAGYKAVTFVIERGESSIATVFVDKLRQALSTGGTHTLPLPRRITEVCFVDEDLIGFSGFDPQTYTVPPDILRGVRIGDPTNVWLLDEKTERHSFTLPPLKVPRHVLCIPAQVDEVSIQVGVGGRFPEVSIP